MQTMTSPVPARPSAAEISKIIAHNSNLVKRPGEALPVVKNGTPIAETLAPDLKVQEMLVTPEMARLWLKNNFRNRPVKEDVVKAYARDMQNGCWVFTHQGVAFNDRDELIDGQHRLMAIVMAGVPIRMMVTFGLPSKIDGKEATTMDAVDRGATRSVADQLRIQHGFEQGGTIAQMAVALGSLCFGERTRRLSVGQTLEVYRAFERPIIYCMDRRPKHHGLKQIGFWSAFAFALASEQAMEEQDSFVADCVYVFATGEKLVEGTPIALLREFAMSDEAKFFQRSMNRGIAELTLQALWLQFNGQMPAKLEMGLDGANYYRELQAERVKKIGDIFRLPKEAEPNGKILVKKTVSVPEAKTPGEGTRPTKTAAPERPSLDKILRVAEGHFGIGKVILLNRRANEEMVVSSRNCMLRLMEELGHGKAAIAAATGFEVNALTGVLAGFADELKVNTRACRKYAAFKNRVLS